MYLVGYTGAKRTNVHAYDIDFTTRLLLEGNTKSAYIEISELYHSDLGR